MTPIRAFLAIPLPVELRRSVRSLQQQLDTQITNVRWTRSENLHLTLHFFGQTTQETLEKIKVSVLSVNSYQQRFEIGVRGLGAFPVTHRAQTLWLGFDNEARIRRLHETCQKALLQNDVAVRTGRYKPHLTIGRCRRQGTDATEVCNKLDNAVIGSLQVDQLVLFESRLHADGAEHIPLTTVTLDDHNDL